MTKFFLFLSCCFLGTSAFAMNDFIKEPQVPHPKYVDEMTPIELEMTLNGYNRCNLHTPNKNFPYNVDAVSAPGEDGPLFFLEITPKGKKKSKILYLPTEPIITGMLYSKISTLLGNGWNASVSIVPGDKSFSILIHDISDGWFGYSAIDLSAVCPITN